jgi:hypothetical protein
MHYFLYVIKFIANTNIDRSSSAELLQYETTFASQIHFYTEYMYCTCLKILIFYDSEAYCKVFLSWRYCAVTDSYDTTKSETEITVYMCILYINVQEISQINLIIFDCRIPEHTSARWTRSLSEDAPSTWMSSFPRWESSFHRPESSFHQMESSVFYRLESSFPRENRGESSFHELNVVIWWRGAEHGASVLSNACFELMCFDTNAVALGLVQRCLGRSWCLYFPGS